MEFKPLHFINEPIIVSFPSSPGIEKRPACPSQFIWRNDEYHIIELINEWHDYTRHGRMARNMQPQHAALAVKRGSWGVGIFHFRVKTSQEKFFDIYYDRSPKDADDRKGRWFLYQELTPVVLE